MKYRGEGDVVVFPVNASGAQNMDLSMAVFARQRCALYRQSATEAAYSNATTNQLEVNTAAIQALGFYRCRITGDYATDVLSDNAQLTISNHNECAPAISETELILNPEGTIVIDLKDLITTNGTLDFTSIVVTGLPSSGATATIDNGCPHHPIFRYKFFRNGDDYRTGMQYEWRLY
ncbi:MAG: hypothetical protein WDO15_06670 [Bacteroidota bacterium]